MSKIIELIKLNEEIKKCHKCKGLNIKRLTENAPGYGNIHSGIIIIGQSLCRECMYTQIPFTGGSGLLLDEIFRLSGVVKKDIFITNVVKCHPKNNEPNKKEWIDNCFDYLEKEINIIKPKLIIPLGKDAISLFLGNAKVNTVIYTIFRGDDYDVYPMWHPAYMKYSGADKAMEGRVYKDKMSKIIKKYINKEEE